LGLIALAGVCLAEPSLAQDAETQKTAEGLVSLGTDPTLGLDPSVPQVAALPGGMTPAFGQRAAGDEGWRFDFHGLLTVPLRAGLNTRENPGPGQSRNVLHAPPIVPDDFDTFSHTGVVPTPYVQLNFAYGSPTIAGNVSVLARQPSVSAGVFDPPSQAGINDAFLRLQPDLGQAVRAQIYVGAFTSRYGVMGEYDEGRYGTPLIARLHGAGENILVSFGLSQDFRVMLEQGILGNGNKAGAGITPDGWNDFADPSVGTTLVNHWHLGLGYRGLVTLGGHFISAWCQDDYATGTLGPDGTIKVFGGDLRLTLGRFGHLYFAASRTDADHSRTVGRMIEVLNTRGGQGLIDNYLGPASEGTGKLTTFGAQYDLSLGRLLSYPVLFSPEGPDIVLSLFGMQTYVRSDDALYDRVTKRKFGAEASYGLLSWLAVSTRYDRVTPKVDNERYSFAVLSPRVIFRSDWNSTDQVVLQYSHWFNGSLTTVRTGYPPRDDPSAIPDEDMISLSASMWW
jgi:hypothetical protein